MGKKEGDGKACASALAIKKGGAAGGVTKQAAATGGGGKASKGAPEKAGKRAVEKNDDCDLDDIFAAKTKGGSSGAVKAGKGGEGDADDAKSKAKKERDAEIAAEEARYKGTTGKGGRKLVDGLAVYTAAEMEAEMGDEAWEAFMDAAEPGLQ